MSVTNPIDRLGEIIGSGPEMARVFDLLLKASEVNVPVLIEGETGTGKELVAREIHVRGPRSAKPFVTVHTGILSHELVASELFGHQRGAFTGAVDDKLGRFAEAEGGTLFLDEIATMEDRVQVAFLRVLEEGVFRPLGGKSDEKVDVRIIAATNRNLREAVASAAFREDLLQRLTVFRIVLPPLRTHMEDLPALVSHFLARSCEEFALRVRGVSAEAIELLRSYLWPGNVRELKNAVAQAAIMAGEGLIGVEHIPPRVCDPVILSREELSEEEVPQSLPPTAREQAPPSALTAVPCVSDTEAAQSCAIPMGLTLDEAMREYTLRTLESVSGNKSRAAVILGVSRKTLRQRLLRWGVA